MGLAASAGGLARCGIHVARGPSHAPSHLEVWTAGVVGAADAVAVVEGVVRVPGPLDGLQLVVVRPVPHPPVGLGAAREVGVLRQDNC